MLRFTPLLVTEEEVQVIFAEKSTSRKAVLMEEMEVVEGM
jgi:hypothetical protein